MGCRPNRATGSRSRLVLQEEACWGTPLSNQDAIGWEIRSENLVADINSIRSELIRGDRMRAPSQQGNERPGGNVVGELQPHGPWALVLRHALGGSVVTAGSAPYTHSLQGSVNLPADDNDIQGLTIEKRFGFPDGTTYRRLQYRGSLVNTLQVQVPSEGIVQATAGILARQEFEADADLHAAPSYPASNEPFNSFHGAILMDLEGDGTRTAIASLTSWDMTINNNISPDEFAIDGTRYRADAVPDERVIDGNLGAFFTDENWKLYQAFRNNTSLSLDITLSRGLYSWRFVVPQFKIRGQVTPVVAGRGPINLPMQWEAHRDEDLGTDLQATITNADPLLSTAA